MSFKRRVGTLTFPTGGTGSIEIGLGAAYGRVHAIELKGDDTNVDTNTTYALTDAAGRVILTAIALDAGTDDSSVKDTAQSESIGGLAASTVGVMRYLSFDEAKSIQSSGAVITDNVGGAGSGVFAKSPVTVAMAAGTSGDVIQVALFVEV